MSIGQTHRDICRYVVECLLNDGKATALPKLLKEFKGKLDEPLQELLASNVLRISTYGSEAYLPRACAFDLSGNPASLSLARHSTETVIQILLLLYDLEVESESTSPRQFTPKDVEAEAHNRSVEIDSRGIRVGLFLAQEFNALYTSRLDDQQVWITSFAPSPRIYKIAENKSVWDEHTKQCKIALERNWEARSVDANATDVPDVPTESLVEPREQLAIAPMAFLRRAISAVPAVKWALGVGGIVAVLVIIKGFAINWVTAALGTAVMFVFMAVLVVFARLAEEKRGSLRKLSFFVAWSSVLLTMATALALFLSIFFNWPLHLKDRIEPSSTNTNSAEPTKARKVQPDNAGMAENQKQMSTHESPTEARKAYESALKQWQSGEPFKAVDDLVKALKLDPSYEDARKLKTQILSKAKADHDNPAKTQLTTDPGKSEDPDGFETPNNRDSPTTKGMEDYVWAMKLLAYYDDPEGAIKYCNMAISEYPDLRIIVLQLRAAANYRAEKFRDSFVDATTVINYGFKRGFDENRNGSVPAYEWLPSACTYRLRGYAITADGGLADDASLEESQAVKLGCRSIPNGLTKK